MEWKLIGLRQTKGSFINLKNSTAFLHLQLIWLARSKQRKCTNGAVISFTPRGDLNIFISPFEHFRQCISAYTYFKVSNAWRTTYFFYFFFRVNFFFVPCISVFVFHQYFLSSLSVYVFSVLFSSIFSLIWSMGIAATQTKPQRKHFIWKSTRKLSNLRKHINLKNTGHRSTKHKYLK